MASWRSGWGGAVAGFVLAVAAGRAEPAFFAVRVAPILERHCTGCHGAEKQKAGLRLDGYDRVMHGAESGAVVKPGEVKGSELYRRITLPRSDEESMPGEGKPALSADEVKVIELWIAAGASATMPVAEFPTAPVPKVARGAPGPLAPDWRPQAAEIAKLAKALGVKLVPRSENATDGLILRTASAPGRCDDTVLAQLAPVAHLIVDAELARTRVTDAGLRALSACGNLRSLDLTRTAVSSDGLAALQGLSKLERINLTDTAVDARGLALLGEMPGLRQIWAFGTKATAPAAPGEPVAP